jgi:hypothetical protein
LLGSFGSVQRSGVLLAVSDAVEFPVPDGEEVTVPVPVPVPVFVLVEVFVPVPVLVEFSVEV